WSALPGFGYFLSLWIFTSAAVNLWGRLAKRPRREWCRILRVQPGSDFGVLVSRVGTGVLVVGVTTGSSYEVEGDVVTRPSETAADAAYAFRLDSISQRPGPNYIADRAVISVFRNDRRIAILTPERRIYTAARSANPMTEASIDTGVTRDLYVALGDALDGGAWTVRIYVKPFVSWIWSGGILMALGAGLAVLDRRYRRRVKQAPAHEAPPMAAPAPRAYQGARSGVSHRVET